MRKLDEKGNGELDLNLTILGDEKGVHIDIYDSDAGICFLQIKLTPEDFLGLTLGRNAQRQVTGEFHSVHRVGKQLKIDHITFRIPDSIDYKERENIAYAAALTHSACQQGWIPDKYFGSQNSFFTKQKPFEQQELASSRSESWARATVRKWVEKK